MILSSLAMVVLCFGLSAAEDKNAANRANKDSDKAGTHATVSKVDTKNHTITVKMKDKDGKETEKVFKLNEEIRYVDSTGRVAAADIFQSGDEILVIEEEGKVKEMRKDKNNSNNNQRNK